MDSHSQTQSQGPVSERDYASGSESDPDFRNQLQSQRPLKRARHSPPPNPPLDPHPSSSSRPTPPQRTFSTEKVNGNGNGRASNPSASMSPGLGLPPLSLSFVGVEPLDEFILHVADWVHQMIRSKPPDMNGAVEVEAKIGMLREKASGRRLILPVQVETSALFSFMFCHISGHVGGIVLMEVAWSLKLLSLTNWIIGSSPTCLQYVAAQYSIIHQLESKSHGHSSETTHALQRPPQQAQNRLLTARLPLHATLLRPPASDRLLLPLRRSRRSGQNTRHAGPKDGAGARVYEESEAGESGRV